MKLKCRINEVDYDLVQGCTFTENFNETLDSAVICIDQIPEIIDLKPYTDVYIWNADEEFNGYYCAGDFLFINCTVALEFVAIGNSWSTFSTNGAQNDDIPYTTKPFWKRTIENGRMTLSGIFWDIWFEHFLCANAEEEAKLRFEIGYVYNLAFSMKLTIKNSAGATSGSHYLHFEVDNPYYNGTNVIKMVSDPYTQGNIPLVNPIICDYDIDKKTISFDIIQNARLYLYETFEIVSVYPWYAYFLKFHSGQERKFDLTLNVDNLSQLDSYDIEVKYLNQWRHTDIEIVGSTETTYDINFIAYREDNYAYTKTITFSKQDGKIVGSYTNESSIVEYGHPSFWGCVDDIRINNLSIVASDYSPLPTFFKHMLVDDFTKTRLKLNDSYKNKEALFKYEINLFSETKKLEKIPLPNISVTQSLVESEKRSCWFYLERFVNLYGPKYKKATNLGKKTWQYIDKYYVSRTDNHYLQNLNPHIITNLRDVFKDVICPEFSLTNPSLRDVISQIMITKDLIPVVFNDVIYGLDIGATNLQTFNRDGTNFDIDSLASDNYATDARREYGNALSQENSAHLIEYLGFRNPDGTFLDLENLTLETRFPIYKINSIKLCYYKRFTLTNHTTGDTISGKYFLCKYDITPFVLQNVVRNTLSTNWQKYNSWDQGLSGTIQEKIATVSQYKLCTVGFDIGSNKITGWGTKYEYLDFLWFKKGYSYIQNLLNVLNQISFVGTEIYDSYLQTLNGENDNPGSYDIDIVTSASDEDLTYIIPFTSANNLPNRIKSIVFEIDYDAMYNGAIVHSKEYTEDDDIVTVDNCSAALTLLEADGLFEKSKLNRMSNNIIKTPARYDNDNGGALISRVQKLATHDELTDSIIYSREYQIFDNVIFANYESTKEYILKNYFTSIWAKYRTYSYMSFGESIKRSENFREFLFLGKENRLYETQHTVPTDENFQNTFLSFLIPDKPSTVGVITNNSQINCGYFEIARNGTKYKYLSDINSFASGTSICYNIAMKDNISGGEYIDSLSANLALTVPAGVSVDDYKATQLWYQMPESTSDAFVETVGIYMCGLDKATFWHDGITDDNELSTNIDRFLHLPAITEDISSYIFLQCGADYVLNKDNKEIIDATIQFDYFTYFSEKDNLLFSPWISKLNNTVGVYKKFEQNEPVVQKTNTGDPISSFLYQEDGNRQVVFKITDAELTRIIDTLTNNSAYSLFYSDYINKFSYSSPLLEYPSGSLATHIQFVSGSNTLNLARITGTANDNNVRTLTILYNWIAKEKTITHWYPFAGTGIYWDWNYQESSQDVSKSGTFTMTFVKSETDSDTGVTYHYFKGTIPISVFAVSMYYADGVWHGSFSTNYSGNSDVAELTDINSAMLTILGNSVSPDYDTYDETNMILIVSTSKLKRSLVYNSYKVDSNNHVDLPEGMYIDTNGINGVTNGRRVPAIFTANNGFITVNANEYNSYPYNIRSIQYYYKDENGWLHFVFGVNVERNENYEYSNFNIYISNVSKRSPKVYDDRHNLIGYNRNYQKMSSATTVYGEDQHYVKGKLEKPTVINIDWDYTDSVLTNFVIEMNNPNPNSCYIFFTTSDSIMAQNTIVVPSGNFKLIVNPTETLSENEINVTNILETEALKYVQDTLDYNVNTFFVDTNDNYEDSVATTLLERDIGQLYPVQFLSVSDGSINNFVIELYNPNFEDCDFVLSYPINNDGEEFEEERTLTISNVHSGVFKLIVNPSGELGYNEFDVTSELENTIQDYLNNDMQANIKGYFYKNEN